MASAINRMSRNGRSHKKNGKMVSVSFLFGFATVPWVRSNCSRNCSVADASSDSRNATTAGGLWDPFCTIVTLAAKSHANDGLVGDCASARDGARSSAVSASIGRGNGFTPARPAAAAWHMQAGMRSTTAANLRAFLAYSEIESRGT